MTWCHLSLMGPVRIVVVIALMAGAVAACSVPVFRYALDHWTPDAYRLHILLRGELTAEQSQIVDRLKSQAAADFANVVVDVGEVDEVSDPSLLASVATSETPDQPLCVLQGPTETQDVYRNVWSGPLVPETGKMLLGSPLRERMVQLFLDGTSVVWVYLDCGDTSIDDSRFAMLEAELQRLEGELELPEIDPADLKELSTSPDDMKLKLSALRLSRDDPSEAVLVQMLLSSEPDLRDVAFSTEPMAFPVFGRGRVLYSLVGNGITPDLIEEACRFLIGGCQCTVKAENPGVDLLLAVDWDGLVSPSVPVEIDVTLTGLAGFQSDSSAGPKPETVAAETAAAELVVEAEPSVEAEPVVAIEPVVEQETEDIDATSETSALPTIPQDSLIESRLQARPAPRTSPILLVSILGLIVVVASFFLLPRR